MPRRQAPRPTRCEAELLTLSQYLEGELTPRTAQAIEQHLDACPCCATVASSLRAMIARCRSAEVRRIPADVRARARARVRALLDATSVAPLPRGRVRSRSTS